MFGPTETQDQLQKEIEKEIESVVSKQTFMELQQDTGLITKKYNDIFFDRRNLTEMCRVLRLSNMQEYLRERQGDMLNLGTFIKAAGLILCAWKAKQIYNKILFGLVYMSFSNLYVDHWLTRKALRNVCLQTTFSIEQQQYRNLYEFYFPNDRRAPEIQKLSEAYFQFQKQKGGHDKIQF